MCLLTIHVVSNSFQESYPIYILLLLFVILKNTFHEYRLNMFILPIPIFIGKLYVTLSAFIIIHNPKLFIYVANSVLFKLEVNKPKY